MAWELLVRSTRVVDEMAKLSSPVVAARNPLIDIARASTAKQTHYLCEIWWPLVTKAEYFYLPFSSVELHNAANLLVKFVAEIDLYTRSGEASAGH